MWSLRSVAASPLGIPALMVLIDRPMSFFGIIFLILFLGDFFWCWKAHLRLRRLPRPWPAIANVCLWAFTLLQAFGLGMLFFGRRMDWPLETAFPKPVIAGIYIWHCLELLPLMLLCFAERIA